MGYIGLVRGDGKVEYNSRFVLGTAAEQLESGRVYTVDELRLLSDVNFIKTTSDSAKDAKSRWRCEVL